MIDSVIGRYESLSSLTDIVAKQSKIVQDTLKAAGQDVSVVDSDPLAYPTETNRDKAFQQARLDLMEASRQIYELMMGPSMKTWADPMASFHLCNALRVFHLYKVPENVPLEGSISYADLSKKVGIDEDKLTRIIQFAITRNYFHQPQPGQVAHTTASRLLAQDQLARDLSGHFVDDIFPAAANVPEAWAKFGSETNDPNHAPLTVAPYNPKGLNGFEFLKSQPEREKRFGGAMQCLSRENFADVQVTMEGFDWNIIGDNAKVVDCGGSRGHLMSEMLRVNPTATAIVEDLPSVIEHSKALALPPHAEGKLTFQPWNFLEEPQPVRDADVYFFSAIFHDWPDMQCHVILKNLVPAMKTGAKLFISDAVVVEPGETPYHWEAFVRQRDMQMMVGLYSRERTVEQWKQLIAEGVKDLDGDLKLESIGSTIGIWTKV